MDEKCKQIWKDCENFRQLQEAMLLFLRGESPRTIWYMEPVEEETISSTWGSEGYFVTLEGQPGTIKHPTIGIKNSKVGEVGNVT